MRQAETLDAGTSQPRGDLELGGRLLPVHAGSQPLFCLDQLPAPTPCQVGPLSPPRFLQVNRDALGSQAR